MAKNGFKSPFFLLYLKCLSSLKPFWVGGSELIEFYNTACSKSFNILAVIDLIEMNWQGRKNVLNQISGDETIMDFCLCLNVILMRRRLIETASVSIRYLKDFSFKLIKRH